MDSKKLLKILAVLILLIFIVNFLASKFYWYSSIWYFDMIMHTLGGIWLGLAFLYIFPPENDSLKIVFKILALVFLVGVAWELYEILFYNIFAGNPFNTLDTISDVFFDLSGGSIAILYFFKRIMFTKESEVQLD